MGRKKLEIKRIESKSSRQVTFTKRRNGLIKKAKELSILCDVDLGLLIYSARGKLFNFTNSNNSLPDIIERYHTCMKLEADEAAAVCGTEQDHSKGGTFLTIKELLHAVERHLEDPDQLTRTDLVNLEDQLEGALLETRAQKTHLMMAAVMNLEEKEKMLKKENQLLAEKIAMAGKKIDEEIDSHLNETPQTLKFL